jgi:hypothetical protein
MGALMLLIPVPALRSLLPGAVTEMFTLFAGVLLFDCLLAANRWSRYITHFGSGSVRLLSVRIVLFGIFAANVWAFGSVLSGLGLMFVLGLSWLLEAIYIAQQMRQPANRSFEA